MKKMIAAVAVAACVFAPQAFAQAKNFEGFSVGANLNLANSTSSYSAPGQTGTANSFAQNIDLLARYNFALGDKFVLGLGVSASVGDLKAGDISATNTIKFTSMTSFFVTPGVAVSDSMQVYGKIAALNVKVTESASATAPSLSGTGYGIGIQQLLSKNMYLQGELMQNNYADYTNGTTVWKFNSSVMSVGIGYKF